MIFWYDLNWGPIQHGGWVNWYPFFSVFFGFDDWCELILMFRKAWNSVPWSWRFLWWKLSRMIKITKTRNSNVAIPQSQEDSALWRNLRGKNSPVSTNRQKIWKNHNFCFLRYFLSNSFGCPDKITIFRPTSWGQVVIKTLMSSKTNHIEVPNLRQLWVDALQRFEVLHHHHLGDLTSSLATWHLGILGKLPNFRVFPSSDHQLSMLLMFETESTLLPHPSLAPMAKRSASSGKRHWAWGKKMLQANWTFANCNVPRRPHLSNEKSELYTYPAALSLHCQTCRCLVLQHRSHVDCRLKWLKWLKRLVYLLNRLWWSPMSLQTFHLRSAPKNSNAHLLFSL